MNKSNPSLSELAQAQRAAQAALAAVERSIEKREDELDREVQQLQDRHRAQVESEFGAALCAAQEALRLATIAAEDERIASASSGSKYPLGTILCEWGREGYYGDRPMRTTGRKGVVEVFTRESAWPSNQVFAKPTPGEVVIRYLTKSGKPGIACIGIGRWDAGEWLPEGVAHPEAKQGGVK